jgi:fibronectin-binding autotransporter adhesin
MNKYTLHLSLTVSCLLSADALGGSVVIDSTLPGHTANMIIPLTGGAYTISASNGYVSGTGTSLNLFHSFQTFNVDTNEAALFTNDLSTPSTSFANILARVTGGTSSTINGTIDSTAFPKANFWFVNPAGVTIGSGAKINVSAGLAIGSADYISFANGDRWYVIDGNGTTGNPSVLSTSSPLDFGFMSNSGAQGLSIVGGKLTTASSPTSPNGGDIRLVSEGPLTIQGTTIDTTVIDPSPLNGGQVTIRSASNVSLSGVTVRTGTGAGTTSISGNGGDVAISGTGVLIAQSTFDTSSQVLVSLGVGYHIPDNFSAVPGSISIQATGVAAAIPSLTTPLLQPLPGVAWLQDSALVAWNYGGSSSAAQVKITGGEVVLNSSGVQSFGLYGGGPANIDLEGTDGVWILQPSGSTKPIPTLVTLADYGADTAPSKISISALGSSGVTVQNAVVDSVSNAPLPISTTDFSSVVINAPTGHVGIDRSIISASSVGAEPAGAVKITGNSVHVNAGVVAATSGSDPAGYQPSDPGACCGSAGGVAITALGARGPQTAGGQFEPSMLIDGGALVTADSSKAYAGHDPNGHPLAVPSAGNISLSATLGTVQINGGQVTTSAGPQAGQAGAIQISGAAVDLQNATVTTTVATANTRDSNGKAFPPASVTLSATGAPITLTNSLIDARTSGAVDAGSVSINGGVINISGGQSPAAFPPVLGKQALPSNTAVFSGTSGTGSAGAITVAGSDLVTVSNATISAQTAGSTGNGGDIQISGSGVLIQQNSLVAADYTNPGGHAGAPGTLSIFASGSASGSDLLEKNLSTATSGVVRVVDSGITAVNDGGLGVLTTDSNGKVIGGSIGARGQIWLGAAAPGVTPTGTADNVVIAGSVVSTEVLAGGLGNDTNVIANKGVWIGQSPGSGYPDPIGNDPRTTSNAGQQRSLVTAQTESTAASSGRILIQGGGGGVTINSSNVNADDQVANTQTLGYSSTQSNININVNGTAGQVSASDAAIQSKSSGVNAAGDISVTGGSTLIIGGQITASTTNLARAGTISIAATHPDEGGPALQIGGGATVSSDATNGQSSLADAGAVSLMSGGSVQVGDSRSNTTAVSTSAGATAGAAGTISVAGARGITFSNAQLLTTVATPSATDVNGNKYVPASVTLTATGAPITLTNSLIDARTSGAVDAGSVSISGGATNISGGQSPKAFGSQALPPNTTIFSGTSGAGNAGAITVSGSDRAMVSNATISAQTAGGTGNGGDISISGTSVSIDPSTVATSTFGTGNAGPITVTATHGTLTLSGAAIESQSNSATLNAGSVGTITLSGGPVQITGNSVISASTAGGVPPAPGSRSDPKAPPIIQITSGGATGLLLDNSNITTSAAVSTGGNIEINAGGSPVVLNNSVILASAGIPGQSGVTGSTTGGSDTGSPTGGNGGNIAINNAGNMSLNGSGILAETPSGSGGQINVNFTPGAVYIQDSRSKVSADSKKGNNGTVSINSPQTDLNSALHPPDVSAAKAPELAANACRRARAHSTFVREGRGGVATAPDGYLTGTPRGVTRSTNADASSGAHPLHALVQVAAVSVTPANCLQ